MASTTDVVKRILPAFQAQQLERVHVVTCCGRIYVGKEPATLCRTCRKVPLSYEVSTDGVGLETVLGPGV